MIVVIFEVWPEPEGRDQYFDLAAALRPELERMDGFISIERFESLTEPRKILSLSFWRDDDAVARWRGHVEHRVRRSRAAAACSATTDYGWPRSCAITGCIRARTRQRTQFRSRFLLPAWQVNHSVAPETNVADIVNRTAPEAT